MEWILALVPILYYMSIIVFMTTNCWNVATEYISDVPFYDFEMIDHLVHVSQVHGSILTNKITRFQKVRFKAVMISCLFFTFFLEYLLMIWLKIIILHCAYFWPSKISAYNFTVIHTPTHLLNTLLFFSWIPIFGKSYNNFPAMCLNFVLMESFYQKNYVWNLFLMRE